MKAVIVLCTVAVAMGLTHAAGYEEWWQRMSLYQIYPRSFKDSDGDGVGDLKGITSKLCHLAESGVNAFWLSPIYPSPMVDFGYDISDFRNIDPVFGTMEDMEELVKVAHAMNLRVIMDFVPNHSSDKHEWFEKSLKNIKPYSDFYVWHEGKVLENGTVTVPNNWVSVFGGSAWTWREERQAYYFHQFAAGQPDLNYNNEDLVNEMKNVLRFWLSKGIDGFRVDAIPHLCEDSRMLDEPLSGQTDDPDNYGYTEKLYTKDQPRTYTIVRGWREVLDEYTKKVNEPRIMMMEAYSNISMTMKYYEFGAHFPFNFDMVTSLDKNSKAVDFKTLIDRWMSNMPEGATPNWVAGNHDRSRMATRYGQERARATTMMTLLLPGVGVTYNGEEIGMEDTWISWENTVDPQGCNAGPDGFETASRDPARTPFQWDDTVSAGFSSNKETWLPVNKNYKTLNLEAQKYEKDSYYTMYRTISKLRNRPVFKDGSLTTKVFADEVLAIARELENEVLYLVVNFGNKEHEIDLSSFEHAPKELSLYYTTADNKLVGTVINDVSKVRIPASSSSVYVNAPKEE